MKNKITSSIFLCALLCPGCSLFVPQSDNSIFHTLGEHKVLDCDLPRKTNSDCVIINLLIGEIPAYADCPYIAIKSERNEVLFSRIDRWAEPFGNACGRVLHDELSDKLRSVMVVFSSYAVGTAYPFDHRLSVDFDDLVYNVHERSVIVKCTWSLLSYLPEQSTERAEEREITMFRYAKATPMAAGKELTSANVVDCMRKALSELAEDIAGKLSELDLKKAK
jgi:uncharacterized lipoprotein YmbA